jgi:hypothetical protein
MLKSVKVLFIALMSLFLIAVAVYFMNGGMNANVALKSSHTGKTTMFWLKALDSFRESIPGAGLKRNELPADKFWKTPTPTPTETPTPTPTPSPTPSGPPQLPPTGSDPNN